MRTAPPVPQEASPSHSSATGSLRLRLLLAAAVTIALALIITGFVLVTLFQHEVTIRLNTELDHDLLQLAGSLQLGPDGAFTLDRPLADPRFNAPLGGRYWRVVEKDGVSGQPLEILRSRSFWDEKFNPEEETGPEGEALITRSRTITYRQAGQIRVLTLIVSAHDDEVSSPVAHFRNRLALYLTLIGLALTLAGWLQVSIGLRPLKRLQSQLEQLRQHKANRLHGQYPQEIAPLVSGFNDVLEMRDQSLERARHRAGDLAHGLMTPLTVLQALSRDLDKRKERQSAADIEQQVDMMRTHIERHLARARLSTGRGHELSPLKASVQAVIATLKRLPQGDEIRWENLVGEAVKVPVERQDLLELLGNLLDNARKYAKSQVRVSYVGRSLIIEDDGPGVPAQALTEISSRGRRLDESRQGFGLGLAIVADIADLYGLELRYGRSALGGLEVRLTSSLENLALS